MCVYDTYIWRVEYTRSIDFWIVISSSLWGKREYCTNDDIAHMTQRKLHTHTHRLIEFVPLLSLCILDPVRELTHYFRWLNARETYPQCTEAASLVSFALSHPFVICHKLNMTLYCASITTVHAFPFRVASMPAVRYDLIYQDYSVICISTKLM